ncbi:MAG: YkvA family protein [Pseudothermotoga sp.]
MKISELNSAVTALYLMRKDKRVPRKAKILISIAVGYALSPVDLIPDFIPFLGQLDDILIVPTLVSMALKSIPKELFEEYKAQVQEKQLNKRFGKITFVIIAVWAVAMIWLICIITKLVHSAI